MTTTSNQNLPSTPMMRVLAAAVHAGVPTLLWGKPGVGKTAVIESLAKVWHRHGETVVGSIRDATDFLGLPVEVNGEVVYSPPAWAKRLAKADKGLLFLDELTTASGSVLKAMLRVIQERWVGELQLPVGTSIVAAANPVDQAVDGNELPAPIANRFLHLDWVFDTETWLTGVTTDFQHVTYPSVTQILTDGSSEHRVRAGAMVTAFLNLNPSLVSPNIPENLGAPNKRGDYGPSYAYPSPRSWTNLIDVLAWIRPSDTAAVLLAAKGCVGEGAAHEFMTWFDAAGLYDPQMVLDGTVKVQWTKDSPDRLYALTQAIVAVTLGRGDAESYNRALDVFADCVTAGRKDVAVPGVRTLLGRSLPKGVTVPLALRDGLADTTLFAVTGR